MVRRRSILRVAGSATAAGLATGLAGCSGGEPDGAGTQTTDDGVDEQLAREHYDEAVTALVENKELLDDWAEGRPGRDQQDIDSHRDNVASARNSLDEAEEVAPEGMVSKIGYVRDVAAFQVALLDFYELAIEFEETRSDAKSFGDSEQHERAAEEYQSAKSVLDDARSQLEDVEATFQEIDPDAGNESDLEYPGEYTRHIDVEGPGSIEAQELMIDGKMNIHQMFVELDAGFGQYENQEFVTARERFTVAEEERQEGANAFDNVQEHDYAWNSLREESIQLLGIVEDLAEALELFIDATHEGEAGNHEQANELVQEGFFVLEKAFE